MTAFRVGLEIGAVLEKDLGKHVDLKSGNRMNVCSRVQCGHGHLAP